MVLQEIFDTAVSGVLKQGDFSIRDRNNACALRGANGMKCAVGWLIQDQDYQAHWENVSAMSEYGTPEELSKTSFGQAIVKTIGPIGEDELTLLRRLQDVHDSSEAECRYNSDLNRITELVRGYREVASDFTLSPAIIDQFEKGTL